MTDRYQFPGANAAAQAGPEIIKRVAIGNDEYIFLLRQAGGTYMVRDSNWVQPCATLAYAEVEFGKLITKHLHRIALTALGVSHGSDDG